MPDSVMHIIIKSERSTWVHIELPNTLSTTLQVNPAWAFWVPLLVEDIEGFRCPALQKSKTTFWGSIKHSKLGGAIQLAQY